MNGAPRLVTLSVRKLVHLRMALSESGLRQPTGPMLPPQAPTSLNPRLVFCWQSAPRFNMLTDCLNLKVVDKPPEHHKTLSHAISRAAATGAIDLQNSGSGDALSSALQTFSVAEDRVGGFRLEQDKAIQKDFLTPWSALTNNQIPAAMKARSNVKSARSISLLS